MSAVDYFAEGIDPFEKEKELGLASSVRSLATLAAGANEAVLAAGARKRSGAASPMDAGTLTDVKGFLLTSLWGNKQDLSLWPVGRQSAGRSAGAMAGLIAFGGRMILANDVDDVAGHIARLKSPARMDIIVDNAGFELFCDLCLADFLVSAGVASVVHLQLKAHPTFVSDAMAKDVAFTLAFLRRDADTALATLGDRWAAHVERGRWRLVENFFWVQPTAMWEMPAELRRDLARSALVVVKGDANYRRLLGEREWPFDTPFADILSYFPAPVCALRTLKAEIACGISREAVQRAKADEDWLVAGKYGVIQFLDTRA